MNTSNTTTDYNQQAVDFLTSTNTEFSVKFLRNGKYFDDDKDDRDIYEITLKRGHRSYSFNFGQSLTNSTKLVDTKTGNEFTMNGSPLKGKMRIVDMKFADDYCKKVKGTPPAPYDVLAGLQKYEVGSFENFCADFGYDTDSRKAEKTYKAVVNEWQNVTMLYNDTELAQLQEIQ